MSIFTQMRDAIKAKAAAATASNVSNAASASISTQEAQKAVTAANQKKWWKTTYPWASSLNAAQHIDYFLTNPKNFINDVLATWDNVSDADKPIYANDIASYMNELNINNNLLLQEKLALVPVGPLGQFTVRIWPSLTDYFWIRWAGEDINAFLSEHLKNLSNIPLDKRKPHIDYFVSWIEKTNAQPLIEKASPELITQFNKIVSGENVSQAAIGTATGGEKLLIGGLLIGGGLWALTSFKKKKRR